MRKFRVYICGSSLECIAMQSLSECQNAKNDGEKTAIRIDRKIGYFKKGNSLNELLAHYACLVIPTISQFHH